MQVTVPDEAHIRLLRDGRVLLRKRCDTHGESQGVLENDARWYRLSNKDRWGRCYRPDRIMEIPVFDGGCCGPGESCETPVDQPWPHDFADQRGNHLSSNFKFDGLKVRL